MQKLKKNVTAPSPFWEWFNCKLLSFHLPLNSHIWSFFTFSLFPCSQMNADIFTSCIHVSQTNLNLPNSCFFAFNHHISSFWFVHPSGPLPFTVPPAKRLLHPERMQQPLRRGLRRQMPAGIRPPRYGHPAVPGGRHLVGLARLL